MARSSRKTSLVDLPPWTGTRIRVGLNWFGWEKPSTGGLFDVDNFRITTSDLLSHQPVQSEQSQNGSIATDCWQWASENRAAIGTMVGLAALTAGSVKAARYLAGRVGQGAETALASSLEAGLNRTNSSAELALAKGKASVLPNLASRVELPYSLPVPRTPLALTPLQTDMQTLLAKMAAARSRTATVGEVSGYEQMLAQMAAAGKLPASFRAALEAAPIAAAGAGKQPLTAAEWLLHATHDGGAHHAGPITDDLLRDLLGIDPKPGTRSLVDETLLQLRRSEGDSNPFSRFMPGLRFEMPALSVRPKG